MSSGSWQDVVHHGMGGVGGRATWQVLARI